MELATSELGLATQPTARQLFDQFRDLEDEFGLGGAQAFLDFPLYRDDEKLVQCQFLLVSKSCGIVLVGLSDAQRSDAPSLKEVEQSLDLAFGQLLARLVKNPNLRNGRVGLRVEFDGFIYAPDLQPDGEHRSGSFPIVRSTAQLRTFLQQQAAKEIDQKVFDEVLATIEGAKGLLRPKERNLTGLPEDSKAQLVAALEEEINRFDRDQVEGYLPSVDGVQRIRGLAGSGKTVVLAMRAALLHLRYPDQRVAVTFHTKSLYQHVKRLITRFYRQYDDRDPDWEKICVLHAWGGRANPGIYYNACLNNGVKPLTYGDAVVAGRMSPFDAACSLLLQQCEVRSEYDHVLVDEAQDFPASFIRLCYALAKNGRLVFAFDQLQTIFQPEPPSMGDVFGRDADGEPLVSLKADTVLHKCYRNPLEVTVCAHALGFGIYGDRIVQMLENQDHWKDLGYEVQTGDLVPGALTQIQRLPHSSPSSISAKCASTQIVSAEVYANASEEVRAVVEQIVDCIRRQGLRPDDVLVISADDRNAKVYLSAIADGLFRRGIESNNLQLDKYSIQDFVRDNSVTLSTIHKAKGNEAYQVFIVGIDALFSPVTVRNRNMVFTAMTRAKAWLRVSGIGQFAQVFKRELDEAVRHLPRLEFRYPTPEDLQIMTRDLRESPEQRAEKMWRDLRDLLSEEELRDMVQRNFDFTKRKPAPRSRKDPKE